MINAPKTFYKVLEVPASVLKRKCEKKRFCEKLALLLNVCQN